MTYKNTLIIDTPKAHYQIREHVETGTFAVKYENMKDGECISQRWYDVKFGADRLAMEICRDGADSDGQANVAIDNVAAALAFKERARSEGVGVSSWAAYSTPALAIAAIKSHARGRGEKIDDIVDQIARQTIRENYKERGDAFATAAEVENILADPGAWPDLWADDVAAKLKVDRDALYFSGKLEPFVDVDDHERAAAEILAAGGIPVQGDRPAETPDPASRAPRYDDRVTLDDWKLEFYRDQLNERIGNLTAIAKDIKESTGTSKVATDRDVALRLSIGQAIESLESAVAFLAAESDTRFAELVDRAKAAAVEPSKEPIFCNSVSKAELDQIIFGVGACLATETGAFGSIAKRDPLKYQTTDQGDGMVLIRFVHPLDEKQIQAIAAEPYGIAYARAMFSETLPLRVKEEIRRRAGRSWPRFCDDGTPIGIMHPDEMDQLQRARTIRDPYRF